MRKASHDGGDSTSITSGQDNDIKKPGAGILKTKKTSIKRKVQNFSLESDDGVIEPLLQKEKDKERPETVNQSAKYFLSKTKTDSMSDKIDEKDKLLDCSKTSVPSKTIVPGITDNRVFVNGIKDNQITKSYASAAPIHNHMNTNTFASHDEVSLAPKTQVLVEIDGKLQKDYSPTPLIFTTAKIHSDGKTKPLEPVHVTPMPILSTLEGSVVKTETSTPNLSGGPSFKNNAPIINSNCNTTDSNTTSIGYDSPANTVSTVSVTFYSEILNKGSSLVKNTSIGSQPFVVTELKTFKYIPSEGKVRDITASKDTAKDKDSMQEKDNKLANAPSSQSKSVKATVTKSCAVPTLPQSETGSRNKSSISVLQPVSDLSVSGSTETNVNKNIQTVNVPSKKKPETSVSVSSSTVILTPRKNDSAISDVERKKHLQSKYVTTEEKTDATEKVRQTISDKAKDCSNSLSFVKSSSNTTDNASSPKISVSNIDSASPLQQNSTLVTESTSASISPNKAVKTTISETTNSTSTPLTSFAVKTSETSIKTSPIGIETCTKPISVTTVESNVVKTPNALNSKVITKSSDKGSEPRTTKFTESMETKSNKSLITSIATTLPKVSSTLKLTEIPMSSQKVTKIPITSSTTNSAKTSTATTEKSSLASSQTASNIPLARSTASDVLKNSTVHNVRPNKTSVSSQISTVKPLAAVTTNTFTTTSLKNPVGSSSTLPSVTPNTSTSLSSQVSTVKPLALTKLKPFANTSLQKSAGSPSTLPSVTTKLSTVTTIKTSSAKPTSIPNMISKSVTPTTETASVTLSKASVSNKTDQSKHEKPSA